MIPVGRQYKSPFSWKTYRRVIAIRREEKKLKALGYRKHETDWEIHRGGRCNERIIDAKVSVCGGYVWTKIGVKKEGG